MSKEEIQPYVDGAHRLLGEDVDSHINKLLPHLAYYGELPEDSPESPLRRTLPPIEVSSGDEFVKYSVMISGNLNTAKTILIRPMSWSDHPGRGFEALREALIANPDKGLAVVGISFPGSGFSSEHMTKRQRQSLKGSQGFSSIGAEQWQAILTAMQNELSAHRLPEGVPTKSVFDYEYVLAGHSQGASNSVGLLQSAPEQVNITALGLVEDVAMEAQGWLQFRLAFLTKGTAHFPDYTKVNPFNHFDDLGPDWGAVGLGKNVLTRPASHLGSVVKAMRVGTDMDKIIAAVNEKDIKSLAITIADGSLGLGSVSASESQAVLLNKTAKTLKASDSILARTIVWQGHYHAAMENLANAQHAFRSFAE